MRPRLWALVNVAHDAVSVERANQLAAFWTRELPCDEALAALTEAYNNLADNWEALAARATQMEEALRLIEASDWYYDCPHDGFGARCPRCIARAAVGEASA